MAKLSRGREHTAGRKFKGLDSHEGEVYSGHQRMMGNSAIARDWHGRFAKKGLGVGEHGAVKEKIGTIEKYSKAESQNLLDHLYAHAQTRQGGVVPGTFLDGRALSSFGKDNPLPKHLQEEGAAYHAHMKKTFGNVPMEDHHMHEWADGGSAKGANIIALTPGEHALVHLLLKQTTGVANGLGFFALKGHEDKLTFRDAFYRRRANIELKTLNVQQTSLKKGIAKMGKGKERDAYLSAKKAEHNRRSAAGQREALATWDMMMSDKSITTQRPSSQLYTDPKFRAQLDTQFASVIGKSEKPSIFAYIKTLLY